MEPDDWLTGKGASFMPAGQATGAEARLIHHELGGLYCVKPAHDASRLAAAGEGRTAPAADLDARFPKADEAYYGELARGAQYLASQASDAVEIVEHGRMATLYLLRAREAAWGESLSR